MTTPPQSPMQRAFDETHRGYIFKSAADRNLALIEFEAGWRAASTGASITAGWLPISEAPKGRDVLLYSPRYLDLTVGDWHHYCRVNQPGFTHYQELPPPPSTKGEPA